MYLVLFNVRHLGLGWAKGVQTGITLESLQTPKEKIAYWGRGQFISEVFMLQLQEFQEEWGNSPKWELTKAMHRHANLGLGVGCWWVCIGLSMRIIPDEAWWALISHLSLWSLESFPGNIPSERHWRWLTSPACFSRWWILMELCYKSGLAKGGEHIPFNGMLKTKSLEC